MSVAAFRATVTNVAALGQLLKISKINVAALRRSGTTAATLHRLPRHYSHLSAAALALRATALAPKREFSNFSQKFHNDP